MQWEKVKNIIKIQFEDQNDSTFEYLVEKLNSRVIKKGRHLVVDGYFVLRMFLEFYIREKEQKISLLKDTFL